MGASRHEAVLFRSGTMAGLSDGELLDRFLDRPEAGSEAAFETIVARHGPMVLAACRRQLRNPDDAADAFQATFLTLARKARSIRGRGSLGGWLHRVARHASTRARHRSARRSEVESLKGDGAEPRSELPASTVERDELREVIDEEMGRLPRTFRAPLVLCYLEGLTHDEAAEQLRWPVGTVRSRLARGRDRLRSRLIRRGVAPASCALGASWLPKSAGAATPPSLVDLTLKAASQVAAGQPVATASVAAHSLMEGVVRTMFLKKLRTTCLALALLGGLGLGVGKLSASDPKPPALPTAVVQDPPKKAPAKAESPGRWEDLKGDWDVVSVEDSGEHMTPKEARFNECLIIPPAVNAKDGRSSPGAFIFLQDSRLFEEWSVPDFDPAASPKALRLVSRGDSLWIADRSGFSYHSGLYRQLGDELSICLSRGDRLDDHPEAPKKIASEAETHTTLINLKRRPANDLRELRRNSMQGTWEVASVEPAGDLPLSPKPGQIWVVGPDTIRRMDGKKVFSEMTYLLHVPPYGNVALTDPKEGNFLAEKWDEDRGMTLRFCYGKARPKFEYGKIRPEDLNADPEKGSVLVVLKRLTDPPASVPNSK